MSRNVEILKKADRIKELFGPPQTSVAELDSETLTQFDGDFSLAASPLQEPLAPCSWRDSREPTPLSSGLSSNAEELRELLCLFENSALSSSIGVCPAKRGESTAPLVAVLGEYLNSHSESPVLLVEATFGRPSLAKIFDVPAAPGFREMLQDPSGARPDCTHKSPFDHLWILPAGGPADERVLDDLEQRFEEAHQRLLTQFRSLVIELPPVDDNRAVQFPYRLPDAVVLAVRPYTTGVRDLRSAIRKLTAANANLVGTILDDVELWHAVHKQGSWRRKITSVLKRHQSR